MTMMRTAFVARERRLVGLMQAQNSNLHAEFCLRYSMSRLR